MASFKVDPSQFAGAMKAHARAMPDVIRDGAVAGAMRGWAHMPKKTPHNLGNMAAAWRASKTGSPTTPAELVNAAPYAGIVEMGARPHAVNEEGLRALADWVQRKMGVDRKEAERIAAAIAWKLRTRGQKPTFFFRNELDTLAKLAERECARVVAKHLGKGGK